MLPPELPSHRKPQHLLEIKLRDIRPHTTLIIEQVLPQARTNTITTTVYRRLRQVSQRVDPPRKHNSNKAAPQAHLIRTETYRPFVTNSDSKAPQHLPAPCLPIRTRLQHPRTLPPPFSIPLTPKPTINIITFGTSPNTPRPKANLPIIHKIDCRTLSTPFSSSTQNKHTGLSPQISSPFLATTEAKSVYYNALATILKRLEREGDAFTHEKHVYVLVYCTAGIHRSVAMGEHLAKALRASAREGAMFGEVDVRHLGLEALLQREGKGRWPQLERDLENARTRHQSTGHKVPQTHQVLLRESRRSDTGDMCHWNAERRGRGDDIEDGRKRVRWYDGGGFTERSRREEREWDTSDEFMSSRRLSSRKGKKP